MAKKKRLSNKEALRRARDVRDEIAEMVVKTEDPEVKEDLRAVRRIIEDKVATMEERRDQVRVASRAIAETTVTPMRVVGLNSPADTIVQVTEKAAVAIYDRLPAKDTPIERDKAKDTRADSEQAK